MVFTFAPHPTTILLKPTIKAERMIAEARKTKLDSKLLVDGVAIG